MKVEVQGQRGAFTLDASFVIPEQGVTALFGRSAAGKTTILRCIAGLEEMNLAYITIGDEVWNDSAKGINVAAHKRAIGYVFQDSLLFPHIKVEENINYGYKRAGARAHKLKFDDVIDFMQINHLLQRYASNLSGGEQKRVAIARALMASPKLLMMDEPLASLDEVGKQEIFPLLEKMHRELDVPMIYVCHSTKELVRLADTLVLLDQGKVLAQGALMDVLADVDVFPSLEGSVLSGVVGGYDEQDHLTAVMVGDDRLLVGGKLGNVGEQVRVFVSMSDVSIALSYSQQTSILNILQAQVIAIHDLDDSSSVVKLQMGDKGGPHIIKSRITRYSKEKLELALGQKVFAQIKGVALSRSFNIAAGQY